MLYNRDYYQEIVKIRNILQDWIILMFPTLCIQYNEKQSALSSHKISIIIF